MIVAAIAGLASPALLCAEAVREYLDETTAATITIAAEPLIFARERTDLAVNARDYISLVPLEINRAGNRSYHWFAYVWSTIDRRDDQPIVSTSDELVLMADGRPIRLASEGRSLRELGIAQPPMRSPVRSAVPLLFLVDPEIIGYVGTATDLNVHLIRGESDELFTLWADARNALREFVHHLGPR